MRRLLVTMAAASCLACSACERHDERHPVRWTEHVSLGSLAEADDALDRPLVTLNGNEQLTMSPASLARPTGEPDVVHVHTVREYLRYEALGYVPKTNHDIAVQGWFKQAAVPSKYLRHAQASKVSYLADSRHVAELPVELGPWGPLENTREEQAAMSAGKTWADLWPDAVRSSEVPHSVDIRADGVMQTIDLLAWGDFNGDRIEDVLLFVYHRVIDGSFHSYGGVIVTRLTPGGPVQIVAWN